MKIRSSSHSSTSITGKNSQRMTGMHSIVAVWRGEVLHDVLKFCVAVLVNLGKGSLILVLLSSFCLIYPPFFSLAASVLISRPLSQLFSSLSPPPVAVWFFHPFLSCLALLDNVHAPFVEILLRKLLLFSSLPRSFVFLFCPEEGLLKVWENESAAAQTPCIPITGWRYLILSDAAFCLYWIRGIFSNRGMICCWGCCFSCFQKAPELVLHAGQEMKR